MVYILNLTCLPKIFMGLDCQYFPDTRDLDKKCGPENSTITDNRQTHGTMRKKHRTQTATSGFAQAWKVLEFREL